MNLTKDGTTTAARPLLRPKFNIGDNVVTPNGRAIEIWKIEREPTSALIIYNGELYETELAIKQSQPQLSPLKIYAYERFRDGQVTLSTREFTGNQYCRRLSDLELALSRVIEGRLC